MNSILLQLLRADPYRDFTGELRIGKTHLLREEDREKTVCGKPLAECPGQTFSGTVDKVDCKVCLRSLECDNRRAENKANYEEQTKQYEEQRKAENARWWIAYNSYLLSPAWNKKRSLVLGRCEKICEGCGERTATQVHHLRYPDGVLPGSYEWIKKEKLFDLVAVCSQCYEDIHDRIS